MEAELYRARSMEYRVFADSFLSIPTVESVGFMMAIFKDMSKDAFGFDPKGAQPTITEKELEEIAIDRTRLMRGLTPDGPTPPCQSAFSSKPAQSSIQSLLEFYACCSYSIDKDAREAPDYLGVELAFASKLCSDLADLYSTNASKNEIQTAKESLGMFIVRFVGPLTLEYTAVMERHANTRYFRQFSCLLREFIKSELECVS